MENFTVYAITGKYNRNFYNIDALKKAAYKFIDEWYVHLDIQDQNYIVQFIPRDSSMENKDVIQLFENELLSQEVRAMVFNKTHTLRELLVARAMASTMVVGDDIPEKIQAEENIDNTPKLDSILKDWFSDEKGSSV